MPSPILSDSEMSREDQEGERGSDSSVPVLAIPTMVAVTIGDGDRRPASIPTASESLTRERIATASTITVEQIPLNRMEVIRARLQERQFSPEAIELLLASSRTSTPTAYQSAWGSWRRWCMARNYNHLSNALINIF